VHLYYGARDVAAPRFDLNRRRGSDREARNAGPAMLGAREENPPYRKPISDQLVPWIAGIAVALVSILVIWVITGMLRHSTASPDESA